MGIIQQAINQAAGTIGVAARLSPTLEENRQVKELEKQYTKLGKIQEESDFSEATVKEITGEQGDIAKAIAKIKPTEENVKRYQVERESLESMKPENIAAKEAFVRQQKANQKAADIQTGQQQQKQNFLDFIGFVTDPGEVEKAFKEMKKDGK